MADKKKARKWTNLGPNTFHLSPREKGTLYFAFHPGVVLEAQNDEEEALFERTEKIVELQDEPKRPSESAGKQKE